MVDAQGGGRTRLIPKLFDSVQYLKLYGIQVRILSDCILVFDTALPLGTAIRQNRIQRRYDSLERQAHGYVREGGTVIMSAW